MGHVLYTIYSVMRDTHAGVSWLCRALVTSCELWVVCIMILLECPNLFLEDDCLPFAHLLLFGEDIHGDGKVVELFIEHPRR